jgi:putative selenate reductase
MSDRMVPIPFDKLLNRIIEEYSARGTFFSVRKHYSNPIRRYYGVFGEKMETAFGPAAGPHTQLAQNIISAYFAGARFFELKTVQTLDGEDLPVSKPCIRAEEEGYNVEWSTELKVREAMEEYIKAWFALKLISKEFGTGEPDGFIFNMSVGYDLDGIKSGKIERFIEGLKNAGTTDIWKECKRAALNRLPGFHHINEEYIDAISDKVCTSVTLSTLHGCPPEEIERISGYLLKEKHLNTFIKCNPTLLGYETARKTLDSMGYDYMDFDEHHFNNDLQYRDAVPMIERLVKLSGEAGLTFGVKLTNTFPVNVRNRELPGGEMYMSGMALYPLTLSVAVKLSRSFGGNLRMSFSGGIDAFNISGIVKAGIWPVTMATTLLKPGGYARLFQMAETLDTLREEPGEEIIGFKGIDQAQLKELLEKAMTDQHHMAASKDRASFKSSRALPITDCFIAPCEDSCPIRQDIPEYISLAGEGRYKEALERIMNKNPLPFITGTICNHACMGRCTRNFYEAPVTIRQVKLEAAMKAYDEILPEIRPSGKRTDIKAAVIGGGPAGIAVSYFLAKAGAAVTVFEKEESLGGIVRHVVPEFRIPVSSVEKDVSFIRKLGVEIKTGLEIKGDQELLEQGYTHIVLAVGAAKPITVDIPGAEPLYAISFLRQARKNRIRLGENVAVVGGGNTAMDVARAAKRIPGVKTVSLIYRRNKRLMPADEEELQAALEDKVQLYELANPVSYEKGILKCERMKLGQADESGRKRPAATGEYFEIQTDDIIVAAGEKPDADFLTNHFGTGTYLIGDCNEKPKTVVEAIRDARNAADEILEESAERQEEYRMREYTAKAVDEKKGRLAWPDSGPASSLCLQCSSVCENCIDVCPNRANIGIDIGEGEMSQILHLDDLCNECGNCASFCPFSGRPYKDKLTLFGSLEMMETSENPGFFIERDSGKIYVNEELNTVRTDKIDKMISVVKDREIR